MNRAERRRQARRGARELSARVEALAEEGQNPIGFLYSGTGEFAPAGPERELPPKVPGEHRWIVAMAHMVSEEHVRLELRAREGSGEIQRLDNDTLLSMSIGCYDCELPLGEITPGSVCSDPGLAR